MPKAELNRKPGDPRNLLNEVRRLIKEARRQRPSMSPSPHSIGSIGKRALLGALGNERAAYGEQIVATLSRQLVHEFGRGFEEKNLRKMMQFAEAFPDESIVARHTVATIELVALPRASTLG